MTVKDVMTVGIEKIFFRMLPADIIHSIRSRINMAVEGQQEVILEQGLYINGMMKTLKLTKYFIHAHSYL